MERYYETHKSFELDKNGRPVPIEFDVAAFNLAFQADCRESFEKMTGVKYEDAADDACDFSSMEAAEAIRKANEAAGKTRSRLLSHLQDDRGIDFDTFQPSTTHSGPSKPTIEPSKSDSPPYPPGDGLPPLLSPSVHILALLTATAITLIRHRELARFVLYWLARAAGVDLAAWPSTVHLLPAALRDTIPTPTTKTNTTKPNTPEINTRRGAISRDPRRGATNRGTTARDTTPWETTSPFTTTNPFTTSSRPPHRYPYPPYAPTTTTFPNHTPTTTNPTTNPTPNTTTTTTTTTTTRTPPSRYWATLHALRWQEGLSEPVASSLQAWYIVTLLLLISTCSPGTGETILSAVWSALLWPVLQVYLLVVVLTGCVRWAPELLWFGREVVWFVVLSVGAAVVQVVGMWWAVVRGNWVVLFVAWAGWVSWGLVTRVDHGEVAEGTVGWVLYRSAGLLYWAGDLVRDVARGVMWRA